MTPEQIKQRREAMGLSQGQLATLLGMSVRGLMKWENAERNPGRGANILERALNDLERELAQQRGAVSAAPTRQRVFSVVVDVGPGEAPPPTFPDDDPHRYLAYLENCYGEQLIFHYDTTTEVGTLYHSDTGWESGWPVKEGESPMGPLSEGEQLWLRAAWLEATIGREYRAHKRTEARLAGLDLRPCAEVLVDSGALGAEVAAEVSNAHAALP